MRFILTIGVTLWLASPALAQMPNPELEAAMARLRICVQTQDPACFERELDTAELDPQAKGVVASRWAERGETEAARQLLRLAVEETIQEGPCCGESSYYNYASRLLVLSQRQRRAGFEYDAMRARTAIAQASFPIEGSIQLEMISCANSGYDVRGAEIVDHDTDWITLGGTSPEFAIWMARIESELGYQMRARAAAQVAMEASFYQRPSQRYRGARRIFSTLTDLGFVSLRHEFAENLQEDFLLRYGECDRTIPLARFGYKYRQHFGDEQLDAIAESLADSIETYGLENPSEQTLQDLGHFVERNRNLAKLTRPFEFPPEETPRISSGRSDIDQAFPRSNDPIVDFAFPEEVDLDFLTINSAIFITMPPRQLGGFVRDDRFEGRLHGWFENYAELRFDDYVCAGMHQEASELLTYMAADYEWFEDAMFYAYQFLALGDDQNSLTHLARAIDLLPAQHNEYHRWYQFDRALHPNDGIILDRELPLSRSWQRGYVIAIGMSTGTTNRQPLLEGVSYFESCRLGGQSYYGYEHLPDF